MKDFNTYALRLNAAMEDKLFFMDCVPKDVDLIVDFGCGTGMLLKTLRNRMPRLKDVQMVGYDTSRDMISYASEGVTEGSNLNFTRSITEVLAFLMSSKRSMIIFSSVFHEMSDQEQHNAFDLATKFDMIVVRDMKRPLNNEPISNVTRKRILKQVAPWQAKMFEERWGRIDNKEKMYRFFLMNEFVENFETEVEEDYFGVDWTGMTWIFEDSGFIPLVESSYTLPYRKQQVKRRFNHSMQDITHRRVVWVREELMKNE